MTFSMRSAGATPLLRNRMLRHVLTPLVLAWIAASASILWIANDFTREIFDRAVLNNAYAVSARLQLQSDDRVTLDISEQALDAALFEQAETVYFSVLDQRGQWIAGSPMPAVALPGGYQEWRFGRMEYEGHVLRAVALRHQVGGDDYFIVVAHTTQTRQRYLLRLVLFGSLPVLLMLLPLAVWLWDRIERDLNPLTQLQEALARRDAHDLSPLPIDNAGREVEQVRAAVNALMARLERSINTQREFAGNVAHELRTPLAGIRALAEYGMTQTKPEALREQLQQISHNSQRMARLINQLLDLAMLDEEQVSLHVVAVDLAQVVKQSALRHLDKADKAGVDLGVSGLDESEQSGCIVQADLSLVEGLLDNLIDNALRYGGAEITLVLEVDPLTELCTLAVEDDGPGIPASARQAMMSRWSQGADGEQFGEGSGLGLFLVARYARLLGSQLVLAERVQGQGLRASVTFQRSIGNVKASN